jgi:hypothetical protein
MRMCQGRSTPGNDHAPRRLHSLALVNAAAVAEAHSAGENVPMLAAMADALDSRCDPG